MRLALACRGAQLAKSGCGDRAALAPGRGFAMSWAKRRARAGDASMSCRPRWQIRYQLQIEAAPCSEFYETKQQARDRYFTVKEFSGIEFVELREPGGRLWFRDHFFDAAMK
jgi:hypothetical protein